MKKSINSLFLNGNFYLKNLLDLKRTSNEASQYYYNQCNDFNKIIDHLIKFSSNSVKQGQLLPSYDIKDNPAKIRWVVLNKKGVKALPEWITAQIEAGIIAGNTEINIFKRQKLVSIADLGSMKYFGFLNGFRLPAQELKKLE
jgi:hypothetical protein